MSIASATDARPHVVVLGGGFGGLTAVRALARAPVRITLVDQNNHHLFQPLLYQVATAALATTDVAVPLRHVVRAQANVTVLLARVRALEVGARKVVLEEGELVYDRLIVALGATTHWFGHDEWAAHALSLKDCRDALDVRNRILSSFEAAEHCTAEHGTEEHSTAEHGMAEHSVVEARRARLLTFVVIGGGPTGVELAGALAEIARVTLARDFRHFAPGSARVVLVEAGERILPAFPAVLAASAAATLARLGVEVRTRTPVTGIDGNGVALGVGGGTEKLGAATVLWAAGVRASPLLAQLGAPLDRGGRVLVAPDLTLPGRPEVQVIGDAAAVPWKSGLVPGMAPGAMQMGRHAARNLERALRGEATLPFRFRDKGSLATVGRSSAVAALGRFTFSGFFAWILWVAVHIAYLIGFRNRFVVLVEWAWLYTTRQRGARVILERGARNASEHEARPGAPTPC